MAIVKRKVFAYITHRGRMLVSGHPDFPEAGIQVPAGTVGEGEDPDNAVMREAFEETGLEGLRLQTYLGEAEYYCRERDEIAHRHFYHLTCDDQPPERWRHQEAHPSDGTTEPITFEFFWARLPDEVPPLAPGHDALLPALLASLSRG
jgi:8-oxo-dGTP pyrophosphatase MutT (NUDIX family)